MSEFYRGAIEAVQHRAMQATAIGLSAFTLYASEAAVHTPVAAADTCATEQTSPDTTTKTCYDDTGNVTSVETTTTTVEEGFTEDTFEDTQPADSEPVQKPRKIRSKHYKFRNFNQQDWERPGTACGPTSLAMIVGTLKNNSRITPNTMTRQIPKKWYWPGSGTDPYAFFYIGDHYGLRVKHSNLHAAKNVVKEGGLAIVHANEDISTHFTAAGHYMVLRGVKNGKFRIADPNGRGRSGDSESRLWSASELKRNGIDDVWTFENR